MGGSKPSAPVTYIPTAAAPTLFESRIPEPDFERAGQYLAKIRSDRKVAEQQRYQQVGTPAEIGARQAGIRSQEAASYAASLPKGSQYDAARGIASSNLQQAQADAFNKQSAQNPQEAAYTTPSWAVATAREQGDQEQRDEEARINRMIKAKDLAKKAQDAGSETTQIV
jgi:hypothetical protein